MIAQVNPMSPPKRETREIAHAAEAFDAALARMDAAIAEIENQCVVLRTGISALRETARPIGPDPNSDVFQHVEKITASLARLTQGEAA